MHHSFETNESILGFAVNDDFYKHLNDWSLELFGGTICTTWDKQSKLVKKELIRHLVGYFGAETFNQEGVLKKCGQHLKIVRDQYRGHLANNLKYEHPPMIPQREWKALLEDGREIALRASCHPAHEGMQYFQECNHMFITLYFPLFCNV